MSDVFSGKLQIKANGEPGCFDGYGAVFGNTDRDGDIVAKGAFSSSLATLKPALLWQHEQKSPIGVFDEVREDDRGLYVRGRLSLKGRGEEAYELLKMGALNGLSVGFITKSDERDAVTGIRTILKAELLEVSLVTFPANELARVTMVKAATLSKRELEKKLTQDAGFSVSVARALMRDGFKGLTTTPDAGDTPLMVKQLLSLRDEFRQRRIDNA
ncbi:MAG: HK97 family phage prohead protease [Kordiimonadaceae bacterium]|nr:HK97 family phage prohead protease [Kordiimonadaceae bacterium]